MHGKIKKVFFRVIHYACLLYTSILYIIRKNRQKTEAILHSAQTDELTQVYSRKYAEQFAENALEEAKDGSIHAFFIMDIDKFKDCLLYTSRCV